MLGFILFATTAVMVTAVALAAMAAISIGVLQVAAWAEDFEFKHGRKWWYVRVL